MTEPNQTSNEPPTETAPEPTGADLAAQAALEKAQTDEAAKAAKKQSAAEKRAIANAEKAQAEAAALVAAQAEETAKDSDPNVGVFVGFGATCHGTETGTYAVDPDTGLTTGLYQPEE